MNFSIRTKTLPSVFLISLVACACSTGSVQPTDDALRPSYELAAEDRIQALHAAAPLTVVREYDQLAADSKSAADQQYFRLKAIETLFLNGYSQRALIRLQRIQSPLANQPLVHYLSILEAFGANAQGRPSLALRRLPKDQASLPTNLKILATNVAARAYSALDDSEQALLAQVRLEQYLAQEEDIYRNQEAIWAILQDIPNPQLQKLAGLGYGSIYQGWIDLAKAFYSTRRSSEKLPRAIADWQLRYPSHPATQRLAQQLLENNAISQTIITQIGLLLPLSGKLADLGNVVQNGILAAYYHSDRLNKPEIRVYDSAQDIDIWNLYTQAVDEGAQAIIGALNKNTLTQLANRPRLPVPTIGLNYLSDANHAEVANLIQFGLLPEDEAHEAAHFAIQQGYSRALAMVPNNAWGKRLLVAFRQRFTELGGTLLTHETFSEKANDFSIPIKSLTNLRYSQARHTKLQNTIGKQVKFEPQIRNDADFIFLAASNKLAQQIKPQLNFHHAGHLPVLSTSRANLVDGEDKINRDMDGLFICDIPWMLDTQDHHSTLFEDVNALWPQNNSLSRLYALGIDAYNLIPHLQEMHNNPSVVYNGQTGRLVLNQQSRIRRHLRWVEYVGGQPQLLPEQVRAPSAIEIGDSIFGDG